jgi:hypothetical protein
VPAGTVTGTLKDVEVTFAGVPTVAPGMEVVTRSPLAKLLPLTTIVAVVPFGMAWGSGRPFSVMLERRRTVILGWG